MSRAELSLRHNFIWNLAGNLVYAACQWGMLIVLAKLTSPEQVGIFALGLAVAAPIFFLSQLQLRGVQATDACDEYEFGHYFGLRIITTLVALVIIGLIVSVGDYDRNTAWVVVAVAMSKAFESIADVFYGLLQRHERMDRIAISLLIKGPLALFFMGALVYFTESVVAGGFGLAAAWGIVLAGCDLRNASKTISETNKENENITSSAIRPSFELASMGRLAWLALPLGLTMALLSLNTNIPRYFIEHHFGSAQLGYFAALAYLLAATNTVVSAMGQTCTPRLAKYFVDGNLNAYKALLFKMLMVGAGIGLAGIVVAIFFGGWILTILYSPDYAQYSSVLFWLMVVTGISIIASFLGYAMTAARYFKIQLPLFIVVTFATCIASWKLVPGYGLLGAVASLAVGVFFQLLMSMSVLILALSKRRFV